MAGPARRTKGLSSTGLAPQAVSAVARLARVPMTASRRCQNLTPVECCSNAVEARQPGRMKLCDDRRQVSRDSVGPRRARFVGDAGAAVARGDRLASRKRLGQDAGLSKLFFKQ
jgi:hypothetical protein